MSNVLHGPSVSDKIEVDRGTSNHTLYLAILKHPPIACKMLDFKQLQCSGKVEHCKYDHASLKGEVWALH